MISLEEARSLIVVFVEPLAALERPLAQAHGSILAEDLLATENFPAFDRSAMDGYAIAQGDPAASFRVIGEVAPGEISALEIGAGECVRIFTGAALPTGASQVIMQEHVRREGDLIFLLERSEMTHVRHKGEDAAIGARLMARGTRLRAVELALLAQMGVTTPRVFPKPRVLHLATGNELVAPELTPAPGQIRDSNSTLVAGLLEECGARLIAQRRSADTLAEFISQASAPQNEPWDVLLISGGASVGDYDFGSAALTELGFEKRFHGVNLRPGKPLAFFTRGRQIAFLIPGNPVSHFVVFQVAIRLALERLMGVAPSWSFATAVLTSELGGRADNRETYWPARTFWQAGQLRVEPLGWRSSGDLCGIAGVNALVQRLPGAAPRSSGESAECLLLYP